MWFRARGHLGVRTLKGSQGTWSLGLGVWVVTGTEETSVFWSLRSFDCLPRRVCPCLGACTCVSRTSVAIATGVFLNRTGVGSLRPFGSSSSGIGYTLRRISGRVSRNRIKGFGRLCTGVVGCHTVFAEASTLIQWVELSPSTTPVPPTYVNVTGNTLPLSPSKLMFSGTLGSPTPFVLVSTVETETSTSFPGVRFLMSVFSGPLPKKTPRVCVGRDGCGVETGTLWVESEGRRS